MAAISVIIPTFNRAALLDVAIQSILAQEGANFELVISDNCSEDNTREVVAKYLSDDRVRYFRNAENIGMVRNWRRSVYEYARSDWFMLLSDDDYLTDPQYLAQVSQLIDANPDIVMVYAGGYILDESTGKSVPISLPFSGVVDGSKVFASRGTVKPLDFTLCNVVFNRQKAMELDAFGNPANLSCDSELFLKLSILGNVGIISQPVSVYRYHPGNLVKTIEKSPALIRGNLDMMLPAYVFARDRISGELIKEFKHNTHLDKAIINSLIKLACLSRKEYEIGAEYVIGAAPELVGKQLNSAKFRLMLFLCRVGGWALPTFLRIYRLVRK